MLTLEAWAVLLFPGLLWADNPVVPVIDAEGIQVYNRDVAGSNVTEFLAVTDVAATVETVGEVLADLETYPAWFHGSKSSRLLFREGPGTIVHHLVLSAPMPVRERDVVLRTDISCSRESGHVHLISRALQPPESDRILPVADKAIRITDSLTVWDVHRIDGKRSRVRFSSRTDPAGSLPGFVSRLFLQRGPYHTLYRLREMVRLDRYRSAHSAGSVFTCR